MDTLYETRAALVEGLRDVGERVAQLVQDTPIERLYAPPTAGWSAADYFKHLILSVKPLVKGLEISLAGLQATFGVPTHIPRDYSELVRVYQQRIAEGMRAENDPRVLPVSYRIPSEVEAAIAAGTLSEQSYLLKTWQDATERLLRVVGAWDENDFDHAQMPHPAIGMVTVREMLYFTLYHNTIHLQDMEQAIRGE